MSTIAIGDIHGNLEALTDLLDQIRGEVRRSDTIVFLGDYMDRGPDSKGCVDAILRLQRESEAEIVCLLGNHEEWFLRTLHDHSHHSWLLGMEAFDTIRSYSIAAATTLREAVSNAGLDLFLGRCRLPYEVFSTLCRLTTSSSWRPCVPPIGPPTVWRHTAVSIR
jgi:hypothetical protein